MDIPAFVSLNGHRIKVQRWQQQGNVISFTTLIRGEHLGKDIAAAANASSVDLDADGQTRLTGTLRILDQRTSGAGVTSALRLELQFTADVDSLQQMEITTDQKLDVILRELRQLRQEVALLRGTTRTGSRDSVVPPKPGTTMLDFEIPLEDDSAE